jgi:sialidase-1
VKPMLLATAAWTLSLVSLVGPRAEEANCQQSRPLAPAIRERCLETLRSAINSDEFWPAMHAAEALTLAGAGNEVVASLRDRLLVERNDQRRCGLARELYRAGDRACLPVLFNILSDPHSQGRVHAAESLYKLAEAGDDNRLRAAFEQTANPQLQLMAAAALARAGHADALALLRERLRSNDRLVRNTVAFALARLGGEQDIEPLINALNSETDVLSRAILVSSLASLGNARGRDELGRNLDSTDAAVRTASAECAGHCRCFEHQTKLIRLLDDSALDARVRAAQSLIAWSLPAARRCIP